MKTKVMRLKPEEIKLIEFIRFLKLDPAKLTIKLSEEEFDNAIISLKDDDK